MPFIRFTERELACLKYIFGQHTSFVYGQEMASISQKLAQYPRPFEHEGKRFVRLGHGYRVVPILQQPTNPEDPE